MEELNKENYPAAMVNILNFYFLNRARSDFVIIQENSKCHYTYTT